MREKLAKLIDVKSIVTLGLSVCMAMLLFGGFQPPQEALALLEPLRVIPGEAKEFRFLCRLPGEVTLKALPTKGVMGGMR